MKRNCKGNRKCNKKLFFTNIVTYIRNIAGTFTFNTSFTKTIGQYSKFSFGRLNAGKENSQLFLEKRLGREKKAGKEFRTRIQTPWRLTLLPVIELKQRRLFHPCFSCTCAYNSTTWGRKRDGIEAIVIVSEDNSLSTSFSLLSSCSNSLRDRLADSNFTPYCHNYERLHEE